MLAPRHFMLVLGLLAAPAIAQIAGTASGQGALEPGRKFALSARINADGSAIGQATLVSRDGTGAAANQPYPLHVTLTCGRRLDERTAIFGGVTQKSAGQNLVEAVTFSVQDNGEPGAGKDLISRAYVVAGGAAGLAGQCLGATLAELPLEPVVAGNINLR